MLSGVCLLGAKDGQGQGLAVGKATLWGRLQRGQVGESRSHGALDRGAILRVWPMDCGNTEEGRHSGPYPHVFFICSFIPDFKISKYASAVYLFHE